MVFCKLVIIYNGIKHEVVQFFENNTVDNPEKDCVDCWVRYLCGGACVVLPLDYGQTDILKTKTIYCDVKKMLYEIAMVLCIRFRNIRFRQEQILKGK